MLPRGRRLSTTAIFLYGGACILLAALAASSADETQSDQKSIDNSGVKGGERFVKFQGFDYDHDLLDHINEEKEEAIKVHGQNATDVQISVNGTDVDDDYEYDYWDEWSDSDEEYYKDSFSHFMDIQKQQTGVQNETKEVKKDKEPDVDTNAPQQPMQPSLSEKEQDKKEEDDTQEEQKDNVNLETEGNYNWAESSESDSWEEEQEDGEIPQKPVVDNLPTDNDQDSDKYFNPGRWDDLIRLHAVEDVFNNEWTVLHEDTRLPCIMLRGNIKLVVPMSPDSDNRVFVEIPVPHHAVASGSCQSPNNQYQEILLKWNVTIPGRNEVYQNSVYFAFGSNWTSETPELNVPPDMYALIAVTATYYNGEILSSGEDKGIRAYSVKDQLEFLTPRNKSMSCYQDKQIMLGDLHLVLSNIQLEAFRPNLETLSVGEFSTSVLCPNDENIVFDAIMTAIIWFWIAALFLVVGIFVLLLALGHRRRFSEEKGGFGYQILRV